MADIFSLCSLVVWSGGEREGQAQGQIPGPPKDCVTLEKLFRLYKLHFL